MSHHEKTQEELDAMTVPELQDELRAQELPVSGTKDELVQRLLDSYDESDNSNPDDQFNADGSEKEAAPGDEKPPEVPYSFLSDEEKAAKTVDQETQPQQVMREGEPDKDKPT